MKKLLGDHSKPQLAHAMGLRYYNQIYEICGPNANPTLLMLEKLALGLTKLTKRKISIADVLEER